MRVDGRNRGPPGQMDPPQTLQAPTMPMVANGVLVRRRDVRGERVDRRERAGCAYCPSRDAVGSRQMLRPMAGAMMRNSAIRTIELRAGNIDCAPSRAHGPDRSGPRRSGRRRPLRLPHIAQRRPCPVVPPVAGVGNNNRKMTELLHHGDRRHVERCGSPSRTCDAVPAENDVAVATAEDIPPTAATLRSSPRYPCLSSTGLRRCPSSAAA